MVASLGTQRITGSWKLWPVRPYVLHQRCIHLYVCAGRTKISALQCSGQWYHYLCGMFLLQGVKKTRNRPNPYLYQSLAVLAGEMGYVEEARKWFREGTSCLPVG